MDRAALALLALILATLLALYLATVQTQPRRPHIEPWSTPLRHGTG